MERRRLLQLAATGLGTGAFGALGEPIRQLLDLVLGTEHRSAEDWQIACADHLHASRRRPPATVLDGLTVDLFAVQRQLAHTSDEAKATELRRAAAMMATLTANVSTRVGDHASAIRWSQTARRAADASGDTSLRLLVCGEEAGLGLYGQRDYLTVLRLTESAEAIAAGTPSVGLAKVLSAKAKALAMLDRSDEAEQVTRALVDLQDRGIRQAGPSFWMPDAAYFAQSWVAAARGDEATQQRAQEEVERLCRDYQNLANIQLHRALCVINNGGVREGVAHATATLRGLTPDYRTAMITETAKMVLNAVPGESVRVSAVADLRHELTSSAPA
jgi:hypothetical protein